MQKPDVLDLKVVERNVYRLLDGNDFVSHGFNHVKRVATGAAYFASLDGADDEGRTVAYVAGLIHDLSRPKSESKDHTKSSEESAREFLVNYDCHGREDEIVRLVANHRHMTSGSMRSRSVFIADKVLEQMGAYLAFRGAVYIAEVGDFASRNGEGLMDAQCEVITRRMETYPVEGFPAKLRSFVEYQKDLALRFIRHLRSSDKWATNISTFCYDKVRNGTAGSTDDLIERYEPIGTDDVEYRNESIRYLTAFPEALQRFIGI